MKSEAVDPMQQLREKVWHQVFVRTVMNLWVP
jgi:hypothetical protein